jgi:hypothetical protein
MGIADLLGISNNYQAVLAPQDKTSYLDALNRALGRAPGIQEQQQALAGRLQAAEQGQGPSLAQEQLRQGTAQTIAAEKGALAGAKGINRGQASRATAENIAQTGQAAAGQSALTRLQEQLTARAALQGQLGTMGQQNTQLLATEGQLQNQQNANNIANTQQMQQINEQVAKQNTEQAGAIGGGLLSAAGPALMKAVPAIAAMAAHGGEIPAYAHGGVPETSYADRLMTMVQGGHIPGRAEYPGDNYKNDKQHILVSPGEFVQTRTTMQHPGMKDAMEAVNDDPEMADEFIAAVRRAKQSKKGKK